MARYKDVEGYRKLFDEEYKKTRELISEGETHLDNLAEGFSEAGRVIDRMPTADVVPKSEVEELKAIIADHTANEERWQELYADTVDKWEKAYEELEIKLENAKAEVAREIFAEIETLFDKYPTLRNIGGTALAELKKEYAGDKE
jgi:vacuolar-type H+-ATPase subunit I/STV1